MSEKAYAERLSRAIESLGVTQVIRATHGPDRVTVLFRVTSKFDDGKLDERPLLASLERLVLHDPEGKGPWFCHVCSQLLPKQADDGTWRMVKGWSISINSRDFETDLSVVSRLIRGEKAPAKRAGELEEIALGGVGPSRGAPKKEGPGKGKGAQLPKDFTPPRAT